MVPSAGPGALCFTSAKKMGMVPAPGSARSSGTSMDPQSVSGGSSQGSRRSPWAVGTRTSRRKAAMEQ